MFKTTGLTLNLKFVHSIKILRPVDDRSFFDFLFSICYHKTNLVNMKNLILIVVLLSTCIMQAQYRLRQGNIDVIIDNYERDDGSYNTPRNRIQTGTVTVIENYYSNQDQFSNGFNVNPYIYNDPYRFVNYGYGRINPVRGVLGALAYTAGDYLTGNWFPYQDPFLFQQPIFTTPPFNPYGFGNNRWGRWNQWGNWNNRGNWVFGNSNCSGYW